MLASNARTPEAREASGFGSPNPFVSSTTFAYGLEAPARVRAVVLDLQGRELAVLKEGDRNVGYHSFLDKTLESIPGSEKDRRGPVCTRMGPERAWSMPRNRLRGEIDHAADDAR